MLELLELALFCGGFLDTWEETAEAVFLVVACRCDDDVLVARFNEDVEETVVDLLVVCCCCCLGLDDDIV